jgi:hypothetical protein
MISTLLATVLILSNISNISYALWLFCEMLSGEIDALSPYIHVEKDWIIYNSVVFFFFISFVHVWENVIKVYTA